MNTGSSERQQRLAQALRANLRLRKGQERARVNDAVSAEAPDDGADAPPPPNSSPE